MAQNPAKNPPLLKTDQPLPKLDPLGGVLSYLVPGLGQMTQGRWTKGVIFFVGLYGLFFYGMALGNMKNVYLASASTQNSSVGKFFSDLYNRPHFAGQMWIGVAAWPALVQYANYSAAQDRGPVFGTFQRTPSANEINDLQRSTNKLFDLAWVYTVIAGVLNILVIYDAIAGPAFREIKAKPATETTEKKEAPAT